jgi:hypothetical protein
MRQVQTYAPWSFDAPRHALGFFEELVTDNLDIGRPELIELTGATARPTGNARQLPFLSPAVLAAAALPGLLPRAPALLPRAPALLTATDSVLGAEVLCPLVTAAPPKRLVLTATPGVVCVTVSPSFKMEPANASGPGPAVTVLVLPKTLKPKFRLLPGPPTES